MPGTFIALRVHPVTEQRIKDYIDQNDIPVVFPEKEKRRHATVIYAPNDDFVDTYNNECLNKESQFVAIPDRFDIFPAANGGGKCLVLKLLCPDLADHHQKIRDAFNATVTYPDYKPHVTFSYDVGDLDASKLPAFQYPVVLGEEYCEPLKENWLPPPKKN